jgi:hypothetical protein
VVLNDGLVSLATRPSPSRDTTARLPVIASLWSVVLVDMLLPFGECEWPGRFLPAERLQLTMCRPYFGYVHLLRVIWITSDRRPALLTRTGVRHSGRQVLDEEAGLTAGPLGSSRT